MPLLPRLLGAAFLTCFLYLPTYAAQAPLQLKWNELNAAANGRSVVVNLKDGSHVNSIITSVEPSALSVQVTSNSHSTYKKGQVSIPREIVAGLRLIQMRVRGRIVATTIGSVAGLAGG